MNAAGLGFGMRNRIINGAMMVNQRATLNTAVTVNVSSSAYPVDRIFTENGFASTLVVTTNQSSTAPTNFSRSAKVTISTPSTPSTNDYLEYQTRFEGYTIADWNWGTASAVTVTLSFVAYSSVAGTFGGSLANNAANRSYPFSYTLAANTWTTVNITIPGCPDGVWPIDNTLAMYLFLNMGAGSGIKGTNGAWASALYRSSSSATGSITNTSGATFYITGVQLEKGSTATSFDYRPYTTELQLCQRYYQLVGLGGSYLNSASSQQGRFSGTPCVTPRTSPTFTLVSSNIVGNIAAANPTSYNSGATIHLQVQSSAGSGAYTDANYTYSLSAEL
jgi:hypothetical protein